MPLRFLAAGMTALLALAACDSAPATPGARNGGASTSPSPARPRPAGAGGLLSGGVWAIRKVEVAGRQENLPPEARGWIALGNDGTASGSYGCTPFHRKAEVTAGHLTLGQELAPLPAPSLSPAPPTDGPGPCRPEDVAGAPALADFEKKVQAAFDGELSLGTKQTSGYPLELHVRNRQGDDIQLAQARGDDFFGIRWQLVGTTFADEHGPAFTAGDRMYLDFHDDGSMSGKLGCNDVTAKVTFAGTHLYFNDAALTTQRSCSAEIMKEEASVLATLKKSLNYSYWAEPGTLSMSLDEDLAFPAREHGFMLTGKPRP
ncbi:META domain-containing protein [Streptomyces sp. MspMP-M5]|uniref:META domain-containing protein n=1 Tax=unclassified Streptomyces TaxID=2593676 RepID=UPI000380CDD7|nr:META domain-containing protein [Streptomyces sp. MspMP-M5]MYT27730.1 META domain-containing protein [Streptomyces sp. SID8354]